MIDCPLLWLTHRPRPSAGAAFLVTLCGDGLTTEPGFALAHRHGWGIVDGPWVAEWTQPSTEESPISPWDCVPVACRISPVAGVGYPFPPRFLAEQCPVRLEAHEPVDFAHLAAARRVGCLDWICAVARGIPDRHFSELTMTFLERHGIWRLVDQRVMPRHGASPDAPGSWVERIALTIDHVQASEPDQTLRAAQLSWAITGPPMIPPEPHQLTMTKGPRRD